MRVALAILLGIALSACSGAPNLDQAASGMTTDAIRTAITHHMSWGEKLSSEQLGDVATFIATYAGAPDTSPPAGDPGLIVWRASDCGSCHALAAGAASGS